MSARAALLASLLSCLALACSDAASGDDDEAAGGAGGSGDGAGAGGSGDAGGGAGGSSAGADAGEPSDVTGSFVLELMPAVPATADRPAAAAYAKLLGQALAGETPSATHWTMTTEEGECRLFEPAVPFCDPKCTDGAVCVDDGVCAAYPRGIDLGAVTLRGVRTMDGGDSVVMRPLPPSNNYQLPGSPKLSYPPFEAGDEVAIEAEGGELSAFTIRASGIAPLQLMGEDEVDLDPEAATELRWEASASVGARIGVVVDISHHGGQKGEIRCESDDDGELDIPQALGAKLIELGVAGYPTVQVERRSTGSLSLAQGSVELHLSSPVTRKVRIPGLVSCDEPGAQGACPDGQLCQPEYVCR